jgi:AcrR family transcriptional regulator
MSRMPRPRTLTHSAIAAAALAVIEREGLAALSMRAVAGELGAGTMSLYRYVDGRDQLEALVVERVLAAVDIALPRVPWRRRVSLLMKRARGAIAAHPAVVPLLLTRRHTSEASVRWGEAMLAALAEGGFRGRERAIAFRTLLAYVIGAVQAEQFGPLSGGGTAALARLPRAQYPFLADTAPHARRIAPETEFRRGLEIILRGLDPRLRRPR